MNKLHTARLIHFTQTGDQLVSYMARVSNPSNQSNDATSERLIRYLIKHKHWSPFEMVSMCVEINTTRAIAQQILRHRSFSFQEFSQRYSNVDEIGIPTVPQFRLQSEKNRQSSTTSVDSYTNEMLSKEVQSLIDHSLSVYSTLLNKGVAKECAREVLPLSTPTRLYMHGTARSFIHYLQLRTAEDTQLEHRWVAESIKDCFLEAFPTVAQSVF